MYDIPVLHLDDKLVAKGRWGGVGNRGSTPEMGDESDERSVELLLDINGDGSIEDGTPLFLASFLECIRMLTPLP